MKNKKKIWIIIVSVLLTILVVIPAIAFSIVKWGILPPEKLTPLVVREANKLLEGELSCERIELTFWETYPRLGVRLKNGTLVSYATRDSISIAEDTFLPSDTLISFDRALVSVNPIEYFKGEKITIGAIFIENPHIYAYINEEGKANWEVYVSEPDSLTEDEVIEPLPPIDLQRVGIKGGHFIYNDRESDMYTEVDGLDLRLKGALTTGGNKFEVEASSSSILFESEFYTLNNKLALEFKSDIELSDNFNTVRLVGAEMMINNLPFKADGSVEMIPDTTLMKIDMAMELEVSDMNDLLAFVPDEYFKNRKDLKANGSIFLESKVEGFLGDSIVPSVNLCCVVEKGSFFMKGVKQGIESFEMDMDMHINGMHPDSSYVKLEKLNLKGLDTSFSLKGRVDDLFESPFIDGYMKGTIDFTRLAEEFLNPDTLVLHGKMDADIEASFLVDDVLDGRYNNIKANGKLNIDELTVQSKTSEMDVYISNARFSVDSTKQTSSFIAGDDLLNAFLKVDSMNIQIGEDVNTSLRGLDMSAKTSVTIDTTAVIPVTGHVRIERFRAKLPDSVWVVANNSYFRGGIKPSASNKMTPAMAGALTVDTLRYFDVPLRTFVVMTENTFGLEAMPYRDAMRQQRQARAAQDTTQNQRTRRSATVAGQETAQTGDSTRVARRQQANRQPRRQQETTESSSSNLLRNWEVKGTLKFKETRIMSRLFPLPMKMDATTLKFTTNTVTLTDARFTAGKSDFTFSGEMTNMRRAMLRGGKLEGSMTFRSDYVDCNQLLAAANQGMQYAETLFAGEEAAMKDGSILEMSEDDLTSTLPVVEVTDTTDVLMVIPEFLDLTMRMNIKKMDYDDVEMKNVRGQAIIRNQSLNLRRLRMDSNIGSMDLTMVYTAKDPTEGTAGFELKMDDILVDRLIGLFPSIDSMIPMLRSFEGVVDCQMAATCTLDSTMSVVMPSINSACYLRGVDMVLLDGETFSEISKTLMFKNKQRNLIDSIAVDLSIKDNKIEVFPFLLQMDRYRLAVGGIHHLDMTFDYHISVLKSPVPFKLGIDVKGDLDNFKYKIVRCRYKDIYKPAYEVEMDQTRTNLRAEIREVIRNQMLANAPEMARELDFNRSVRERVDGGQQRRSERVRPAGEEADDVVEYNLEDLNIPLTEDDLPEEEEGNSES